MYYFVINTIKLRKLKAPIEVRKKHFRAGLKYYAVFVPFIIFLGPIMLLLTALNGLASMSSWLETLIGKVLEKTRLGKVADQVSWSWSHNQQKARAWYSEEMRKTKNDD